MSDPVIEETPGFEGSVFIGYRLVRDGMAFSGLKRFGGNGKRLKKPVPIWNPLSEYGHPDERRQLVGTIKDSIKYGVDLSGCSIEKYSLQHGNKKRVIRKDGIIIEETIDWAEYTMMKTNLKFNEVYEEASQALLVEKLSQ